MPMNIRWIAVLAGYVTDILVSSLVLALAHPDSLFEQAPNLARPSDLILICVLTLSTGVGGYVAGRIAHTSRAINGLLVGVVGILFAQIGIANGQPFPRVFVVASAVGCLLAAVGGFL